MRILVLVCAVLFAVLLPGVAFAAQGILLLADEGTPEWNTLLTQLATTVDKQQPAEAVLWPTTPSDIQAAVDRLVHRGVSEIVAVPLFIAEPPSDLSSKVKSSVPIRVAAPLNRAPVVADIVMARAQEISPNPATDVLVVVSHRTSADSDQRWVPDLTTASLQLNNMRRFAAVFPWGVPPGPFQASADQEAAVLRRLLERQITMGRQRIVVVPVLTPYGGTESAINEQLHGFAYELAKSAPLPDDRLVAWILSRAAGK